MSDASYTCERVSKKMSTQTNDGPVKEGISVSMVLEARNNAFGLYAIHILGRYAM